MCVYKHGIANDRQRNVTNVYVIRMGMKEQDSVGMELYFDNAKSCFGLRAAPRCNVRATDIVSK